MGEQERNLDSTVGAATGCLRQDTKLVALDFTQIWIKNLH